MILEDKYTLSNGVEIPKLGLGTWFISDQDVAQAVKEAAKIGYRHIDTAQAYENERGVGEGILACGVKREDLFVTTKLAAEVKSYEGAAPSIDESLKKLGLDYIDMMIIHSPRPWMEYHETEPYFKGNQELSIMAGKYGVSVPRLCIRYALQLDLLPLPKTANPDHMKDNADVDFVISEKDMALLKNMERIKDYGEASVFPVYQ